MSESNITNRRPYRLELIVSLFLILATISVFWKVQTHEFINYDDDVYITENSHVQSGLTRKGIVWAFTTTHAQNWHPLTWISHMLDCNLYGLNPGGHHWNNLLFHVLNTVLLFLVFRRMTGTLWPSVFVAGLFALHPLHVESVAWVSERKDVLSTLFWILTMWAYVRYVEGPGVSRYFLALLSFALGLMSKPMLVTLPFVLLLLDYWPLGRFTYGQQVNAGKTENKNSIDTSQQKSRVLDLVLEKIPFFVLAIASSLVTLFAQQSGGAGLFLGGLSLTTCVANALVSYIRYIVMMIWPHNLAVFYPHPASDIAIWQGLVAALLLVCISVLVIWARRWFPYLATGWLWYLGTLVPVIGIVQVGAQSMADRYTYVPLIGLFIMVAWGGTELSARWRYRRLVLATSMATLLLAFGICTRLQLSHWQNNIALFSHTLDVTANNYLAHNNFGLALVEQGGLEKAISNYAEALRIKPGYVEAHNNLGLALAKQGKLGKAITHYTEALNIRPNSMEAHNNLGLALVEQGCLEEAINHYSEALRIKPDSVEAHNNLGIALVDQGNLKEAITYFSEALQIKPNDAWTHNNIGIALVGLGSLKEAIAHFSEAVRIKPDYVEANNNLRLALQLMVKPKEASNTLGKP